MIANEVDSLPSQSEHETQTRIINLIRDCGGVATRVNSGSLLVKGDNGRCYRVQLADPGTADVLATYKSISLAIEVKHGKNTATPEQIEFLESVARAGGVGMVAYDVEFLESVLSAIDNALEYPPSVPKFYVSNIRTIKPNRLFVEVNK